MKKILYLLAFTILFVGCQLTTSNQHHKVHFVVSVPLTDSVSSIITDAMFIIRDLNMAHSDTLHYDTLKMPIFFVKELSPSLYNVDFKANLTQGTTNYALSAYFRNCAFSEDATFSTEAILAEKDRKEFIFAELFWAGTQTPKGKQYYADKYFVIYNNTLEDTLYADGLLLMESKLKNVKQITIHPKDFRDEFFPMDAMYRIPGNGTDVPVAPGQSILLCDYAIDHRPINANSYDLSTANYEWYDEFTHAYITDLDNPAVPNLEKIYCYSLTLWTPNVQGNTSFALGRLPKDLSASDYLTQYKHDYDYTIVTKAGTFDMSATTYLFPNEWIVEGVNCCPSQTYEWLVLPPRIDAGYTYVAKTGADKSRYGFAARRKIALYHKGRPILQDTNNSSDDFTKVHADPHFFR